MRLRLPRWLRREPVPQGRHVRRPVPVTAPGAAAALVMGAAEPYLVGAPEVPAAAPAAPETDAAAPDGAPVADSVDHTPAHAVPPPVADPVTAGDIGPVTEPIPTLLVSVETAPDEPVVAASSAATPIEDAVTPIEDAVPAVDPVPVLEPALEPTVALGFADGGVHELASDDPRLAGFQDAAAAVLGRLQD